MRLSLRAVSALLLAVGVATCSEAPTSANRRVLQLALAPRFSAESQAIFRNLASFSVTLDNVHVVVRATLTDDQLGPVLKDTTITFPATASEVRIAIELTIQGSQQSVIAAIELREGATSYFGGSQLLLAKVGETTSPPAPVEMSYIGPGAAAQSIFIGPQPATLAPSTSFPFAATAFDVANRAVAGLPITWSVSDPTVFLVSADGLVTSSGKVGSTTLIATGLNGVSAQITVRVQPVARLVVLDGDNQTATAGTLLSRPFLVQALDADGNPVIGAMVNFSAAAGGSVTPASATTNSGGGASANVTLGEAAGVYAFVATASSATSPTVRMTATALAGVIASLGIAGGNDQVDTVRATLAKPLTVEVADSFGNPVAGQAVTFQVTSGRALLAGVAGATPTSSLTVPTEGSGLATASLIADTLAGVVNVSASLPQTTIAPVSFTETIRPGLPAQLLMMQQPSAKAQATLPLGKQPKIQIADQFGNSVPVAGVQVNVIEYCAQCLRVSASPSAASLNRSTAPPRTRAVTLPATRRITAAKPNATRLSIPTAIARTRSISDTFPRGVGGKTAVVTDANGVATFIDLVLNEFVGQWQLEFYRSDGTSRIVFSDVIDLAPGPAESIIAWSVLDTSLISAGDALNPFARVIDKVGNGIPNMSVNWVPDTVSRLDSTSTHTDADGLTSPGVWQTPASTNVTKFSIVVTPSGPKLENSPLTLWACITACP